MKSATMTTATRPSAPRAASTGLHDRTTHFRDARVTYERLRDVPTTCHHCGGLLRRFVVPGVLCSACGRLWVIRELLVQDGP
jgi:hypothetical protein